MAGVGFELKKLFRSQKGYMQSIKAYSVSAVVTQGPMLLNILMLFVMRALLGIFGASVREEEIFLYTITYITIFSLILSNTVLMFVDRYVSDCIYKQEIDRILPAFMSLIFFLLLVGGSVAAVYLLLLPVSNLYRVVNLLQFCVMLIIWSEVAFLSAVKQYTKVMIGFVASVIVSVAAGVLLLYFSGLEPVMAALMGTLCGYLVMMIMFLQQMLVYYPSGRLNLFAFFPALDEHKILIAIGLSMALGLYAHNFVIWTSEYHNEIWRYGVFCTKYDIPTFFATLTIAPLLVRFVVSVETRFYESYREYFDAILYGGTLEDIHIARRNMTRTLFREMSQMMELQLFVTVVCATFLGNFLGQMGLDTEQTSIFRVLCFGYCLYGLAKCLIIVLLYFDDRRGALAGAALFTVLSTVFTWGAMHLDVNFWGSGYLLAAFITVVFTLLRLRYYLDRLEYKVFLNQPLFFSDAKGIFANMAETVEKQEKHFQSNMEARYRDKMEKRRLAREQKHKRQEDEE